MQLQWIEPGDLLPQVNTAWSDNDPIPGLLAAGGDLRVSTLLDAYGHGIFPWFSEGQPILWWAPDPRMALNPLGFKLHRSLKRSLQYFRFSENCEIRIDHDFDAVIRACSRAARPGQSGTWIVRQMISAYSEFHRAGHAHSIETWIDGKLAGGLYCVAVGKAVFGESMFARSTDASKIALAALVCFCRRHGIESIDCQQNTAHLASLGASEIARGDFVAQVARARVQAGPTWRFDPVYWNELLPANPSALT